MKIKIANNRLSVFEGVTNDIKYTMSLDSGFIRYDHINSQVLFSNSRLEIRLEGLTLIDANDVSVDISTFDKLVTRIGKEVNSVNQYGKVINLGATLADPAKTLDLSLASYFHVAVDSAASLEFINPPADKLSFSFIIELSKNATPTIHALTFVSDVVGDVPQNLTKSAQKMILRCYTRDGGVTYHIAQEITGLGIIKNNYAAIVAPAATDDSASGYSIGSRWIDTVLKQEHVLVDATPTAAVWKQTTS